MTILGPFISWEQVNWIKNEDRCGYHKIQNQTIWFSQLSSVSSNPNNFINYGLRDQIRPTQTVWARPCFITKWDQPPHRMGAYNF